MKKKTVVRASTSSPPRPRGVVRSSQSAATVSKSTNAAAIHRSGTRRTANIIKKSAPVGEKRQATRNNTRTGGRESGASAKQGGSREARAPLEQRGKKLVKRRRDASTEPRRSFSIHSPGDRKTGAKKKVQIRDPEIKQGAVSKTVRRRASTQVKSQTRNPIAARLQRTAAKRKGGGKRKVVVDLDAERIERRRLILEKRREWLSKLRARFRKPDVAYVLERACYDFAKDYSDAQNLGETEILAVYMDKVRDIERCAKDILFSEKIIASDFKTRMERLTEIRDIPYLRHDELDPLRWNELIRRKAMREEKLRNSQTTDMFKCRRCKARKSRVWWLQTRSADEPMTMFVQCVCCKGTTRHN